jgi:hypothetical protein
MSSPPMPPHPTQQGGYRMPVLDECGIMVGHAVLIGLVLLSVYVSRIPSEVLDKFSRLPYQFLGLLAVVSITGVYGWIHGILAALAFTLIVSHSLRRTREGLEDYDGPAVLIADSQETDIVPDKQRWFVEKVMGENPFLVRERTVSTSAVQDLSDRGSGTGSSPSSK